MLIEPIHHREIQHQVIAKVDGSANKELQVMVGTRIFFPLSATAYNITVPIEQFCANNLSN